jgi:methylamine dehydrogenase heavy chain
MVRWTLTGFAAGLMAATLPPAIADVPIDATPATLTMSPTEKSWVFIHGSGQTQGTTIYDTLTGRMKGMVDTSKTADLAFDPLGKHYYVSESIWSLGNRGVRQDMVTVYDTVTLKILAEIKIPGRMVIGDRKFNFLVTADGTTGFVYDFNPASSVNIVDLVRNKFVKSIGLPGCATLVLNDAVGFSALCSDGSLATVAYRTGKITRSAPFFKPLEDPVFDNYAFDAQKGVAVFLSYTGLIYTAKMGATPTIAAPFSMQAAAGYRTATSKPLELNYYPGGTQPAALHNASGRLYVLMHPGEYWSQIAPATQIWVVDLATQKIVKRITLDDPVSRVSVTQTDKPLLYLTRGTTGIVMDPETGVKLREIPLAGGGVTYPAS